MAGFQKRGAWRIICRDMSLRLTNLLVFITGLTGYFKTYAFILPCLPFGLSSRPYSLLRLAFVPEIPPRGPSLADFITHFHSCCLLLPSLEWHNSDLSNSRPPNTLSLFVLGFSCGEVGSLIIVDSLLLGLGRRRDKLH